LKIFWSWQSDTPGNIGRYLVRDALDDAIQKLKQASELEEAIREDLHLDQASGMSFSFFSLTDMTRNFSPEGQFDLAGKSASTIPAVISTSRAF
jgi:hypothetical protein